MTPSFRLSPTRALLSALAAVAALAVTAGVSQASPDDSSEDTSSPLGIPLLGGSGGLPDACAVTSSDPKRKKSCNQQGGNGRDGAAGEVHGHPGKGHRKHTQIQYVDQEPDVNGAPGGWGAPRAGTAPGAPGQQGADLDADGYGFGSSDSE